MTQSTKINLMAGLAFALFALLIGLTDYTAYNRGFNEAANICDRTINAQPQYDYHLTLYYDTAWLYNQRGKMVQRGHIDSIEEMILQDNQ